MKTNVIVIDNHGNQITYTNSYYLWWYEEYEIVGVIVVRRNSDNEVNRFKFKDIRRFSEVWVKK